LSHKKDDGLDNSNRPVLSLTAEDLQILSEIEPKLSRNGANLVSLMLRFFNSDGSLDPSKLGGLVQNEQAVEMISLMAPFLAGDQSLSGLFQLFSETNPKKP
jgi:hypothetical protein